MKLWTTLRRAVEGWVAIGRNDPTWRDRFSFSWASLVTAVVLFLLVAFLAVAWASLDIGLPHLLGMVAALIVLGLPVIAMLIALLVTRVWLKSPVPLLDTLVPGIYLMIAFLLLEGVLAVFGPVVMLTWVALGYALYCLVRLAYGWSLGVGAAFATLTVVLLVAMRYGLYMLSMPSAGPT